MSNFYSGKIALITGAASGIGHALARRLAAAGVARLVLVDIDPAGLASVRGEIEKTSTAVTTLRVDVSDRGAMREAFTRLPEDWRRIDVAVANAGISSVTRGDQPESWSIDECERIMKVNYFGSLNVVDLVLAGMLARRQGHLAVVSSLAGWRGLPGSCAYGASKAAQQMFFEGLRVDLKKTGVRVTTAFPGFVDTPINAPLKDHYELPFMVSPDEAAARIAEAIERRRSSIAFPFVSWLLGTVSKLLPDRVYDYIVRHNPYAKRPSPSPSPAREESHG